MPHSCQPLPDTHPPRDTRHVVSSKDRNFDQHVRSSFALERDQQFLAEYHLGALANKYLQ